jgi:hypothetical protein
MYSKRFTKLFFCLELKHGLNNKSEETNLFAAKCADELPLAFELPNLTL